MGHRLLKALNLKNIFLMDGSGAVFSALLTGIVLPNFSEWIGLEPRTLYYLAMFPLVYGIYSLSCYFLVKEKKPWMLLGIIVANLFYCLVSARTILTSDLITHLGRMLLVMEIVVILAVVTIELTIYKRHQ